MSNETEVVLFQKLKEDAICPVKATEFSAGYDLFSTEEVTVIGGEGVVLINTHIAVKLPKNTYGRVAMRSGLAVREHMNVSAGVIDYDYQGGIGIVVYISKINHKYKIRKGERVAQFIVEKIFEGSSRLVDHIERDTKAHVGYGSTGETVVKN